MTAFFSILGRDLRLALRQLSDASLVVLFFVLCAAMFPFAVGPEPNLLARIAPGIITVAAALASLLSLERLFLTDYEDGNLELLVLSPAPLELIVLAKVFVHWCTTGLPLIAAAPLIALLYRMDPAGMPVLLGALALATPVLSLIGAIGAALVLGARRGGVLLSLLMLPLYVPVLIFTVSGTAVALLLLGLADTLVGIFLARILAGVFAANVSVASAYITDVTEPAYAAQRAGATAVSLINTIQSIMGVDLDRLVPLPAVADASSHGGYCGPAVKPIALRMVGQLGRASDFRLPIT